VRQDLWKTIVAVADAMVEAGFQGQHLVFDEAEHADLVNAAWQVCGEHHLRHHPCPTAISAPLDELAGREIGGPLGAEPAQNRESRPHLRMHEHHG
jgi:hypothetical protein